METPIPHRHSPDVWLYAGSRFLERAGYYGVRAIMVLYLIDGSLGMSREDALYIYGSFLGYIFLGRILGALLGDLLLGNKKALIAGGLLQALGAFLMCIPTLTGFYTGLGFVLVGGSLYDPNLLAQFGKLYLPKKRLLDAGYTGLYAVVNVGAFLGILIIGLVSEKVSWNAGFILAGTLILVSVLIAIIPVQRSETQVEAIPSASEISGIKILIAFIFVGLFWAFVEFSGFQVNDIQQAFLENPLLNLPSRSLELLNSGALIFLALIAAFMWTLYYSDQFTKLAYGFLLGASSFGILTLLPEIPSEQHIYLYVFSVLLLAASEVLIAPLVYSVIVRYGNPKYLAILISLSFIPIQFFKATLFNFGELMYAHPMQTFGISAGGLLLIALVLFLWIAIDNKSSFSIEKMEKDS